MKMISAISQWYNIPIGVLGWPVFVLTTSYKLYQEKKIDEGEINASNLDERSSAEELQRQRDYSEEIGEDTREQDRREHNESKLDILFSAGRP